MKWNLLRQRKWSKEGFGRNCKATGIWTFATRKMEVGSSDQTLSIEMVGVFRNRTRESVDLGTKACGITVFIVCPYGRDSTNHR